jgi:Flp pilus assembly protein TadG
MSDHIDANPRDYGRAHRGQSLVEFAILLPLLLLLVGGIVQYGILFATSHTLDQIGRDLGRWVATQDAADCIELGDGVPSPVAERAHAIASASSLMGYTGNPWEANFVSHDYAPMPPTPPANEGVEVAWEAVTGACPPDDSTTASFVTVRLAHRAPVVLPGLGYLPGIGTCDASGCYLAITTTAVYRIEPQAPAPEPSP